MFLVDRDIQALIDSGAITGGPARLADPFSEDSVAQPCSLDLTIGKVSRPGEGAETSLDSYTLGPGETVIVTTAETFALPPEIAGFGFPPTDVSSRGILMVDPGHLDPGYEGSLTFTLVNIGGRPFPLVSGAKICTLLLFSLASPPERGWAERRRLSGAGGANATSRLDIRLAQLTADFLEVEERARAVARQETRANRAGDVWRPLGFLATFVLGVGLAAAVAFFNLKTDVARIDERLNIAGLEQRLDLLEAGVPARLDPEAISTVPSSVDPVDQAPPEASPGVAGSPSAAP